MVNLSTSIKMVERNLARLELMRASRSEEDGSAEVGAEPIDPFDKRWKPESADIKKIQYPRQDVWEGPVSK